MSLSAHRGHKMALGSEESPITPYYDTFQVLMSDEKSMDRSPVHLWPRDEYALKNTIDLSFPVSRASSGQSASRAVYFCQKRLKNQLVTKACGAATSRRHFLPNTIRDLF